eukprot:scaffold25994_cov45-Cyclotella_meneghiniana.AAC.1
MCVSLVGIGFAVICYHPTPRTRNHASRVTQQQAARSPDKIKGSKIEVQVVLSSCPSSTVPTERARDGRTCESSYGMLHSFIRRTID